jgi:hypothetical protein
MEELCEDVQLGFNSGLRDLLTGQEKSNFAYGVCLFSAGGETTGESIISPHVFISVEMVEPLLWKSLTEEERLFTQLRVAETIVHELSRE